MSTTAGTPIATWYKTKSWDWDIEPIQVLKITDKRLTIVSSYDGRPQVADKVSWSASYWQTREQAVEYLRERIERLRTQLASAESEFAATEQEPQL